MESFLNTDAADRPNLVPFELKEGMNPVLLFRRLEVPRRFDIPAMSEDYVAGDRLHGWNRVGSPRFGRALLLTLAKVYCPEAFARPAHPQTTLPRYPETLLRLFDDEIRGFLSTTDGRVEFRGKAPQDDAWHRYELAYDGNGLMIRVDGEKVFEQQLTGAVRCSQDDLFIGKKGPFGYTFDDEMDDVEISTR